jgi:integration host factor subunit beta
VSGQRNGQTSSQLIKHEQIGSHQASPATHPDLLPGDVSRVVDTVLGEIATALSQGRRVELRGFGSFDVRRRRPRVGRNPRTGVAVKVPAKSVLHFKSGKDLRDHLNEDADAKRSHSVQRRSA